jgi:hypothetical protein
VTPKSDPHAVADARASAITAGETFRRAVVPAIAAVLRARLERLVASEPEWHAALSDEVRAAFDDATERAIGQGAAEVGGEVHGGRVARPAGRAGRPPFTRIFVGG